jgi:hypothetical protein
MALGDIEKLEKEGLQVNEVQMLNLNELKDINLNQSAMLDDLNLIESELDRFL